ncbi:MAG: DMT family transporter [Planctomycetota bacterium]
MLLFAGNSLLCRAALEAGPHGPRMDPGSFTAVRIGAGALVLLPALLRSSGARTPSGREVRRGAGRAALAGALLLGYALAFSASYRSVPTGAGALLLFGSVQLTMLVAARLEGERLGPRRAVGALVALAGLVALLAPSREVLGQVDPAGAALMALAGAAWGGYTLLGRGESDPTRATARNFAAAVPAALAATLLWDARVTPTGLALAGASGALCSGAGYALWYAALRGHTAVTAALSQLTVPVVAGLLGLAFLQEPLTLRWAAASSLVLVGVALGLRRKR